MEVLVDGVEAAPFIWVDDGPRKDANCFVAEDAAADTLGVENLNGESEDEVGGIAEEEVLVGVEKVKGELEDDPNPLKGPPNLGVD